LELVFFGLKLYFRVGDFAADLPQKLPTQRGKKPTFDPFWISDLFLVLS
jgi:hypothetical protein